MAHAQPTPPSALEALETRIRQLEERLALAEPEPEPTAMPAPVPPPTRQLERNDETLIRALAAGMSLHGASRTTITARLAEDYGFRDVEAVLGETGL